MIRRTVARVAALVLLGLPAVGLADEGKPAAPAFKAGFAERDITPEIGMEAPGGYGKSYHRSIHDPCKVRAAVFDDGTAQVAIVGIDALGIRRETVLKVRKAIEEKTGIPAERDPDRRVALALVGADRLDHARRVRPRLRRSCRRLAYERVDVRRSRSTSPRSRRRSSTRSAEAHDRRVEAKAGVGKGTEETVAFNRRFRMRNGRTFTHPGQGNPDIVEPAGPVDPEVGVIGAWDAKDPNKLLGCVVNFSCHATTSPGGISANYIYYLEKVDPGLLRQGLRRRLPRRGLGRRHPGRQPQPLPEPERRALGPARRRQGRRRGAEGPARRWSPARSPRSRPATKVWDDQAPGPDARARARRAWRSSRGTSRRPTRPSGPSPRRSSCSTPC